MAKAKAASPATTAAPSSGAHAAAKAATRRKSHPKFELPEIHTHAATDWAFRDNADAPHVAVMPSAADIAATTPKPSSTASTAGTDADISAPWEAPAFLAGAAIGSVAIGFGIAVLSTFAAFEFITAPARIARKLL